jgi:uncharacterized protein
MKMCPVVHFEMPSEDNARMCAFYAKVFGWITEQLGEDMGHYVLATTTETVKKKGVSRPKKPGAINGGFFKKSKENDRVSMVIAVEDIKQSMEMVKNAGGTVFGEPMEIPGVGQFVAFQDTEGNKLSMLQPKM